MVFMGKGFGLRRLLEVLFRVSLLPQEIYRTRKSYFERDRVWGLIKKPWAFIRVP